jgi:hypothetical protein
MPNRSRKPAAKDFNQIARSVVDRATGTPKPVKPAPNKAKPPKPVKAKDVQDIERADSEGMAQPQGLPAVKKKRPVKKAEKDKDPAAVALGRKGGLKGGHARAANLSKEQRSDSAKKAAQARWTKP